MCNLELDQKNQGNIAVIMAMVILVIIALDSLYENQSISSALGSIATFSIAIVSCLTLNEMRKSREQSSKPHLMVLKPKESYTFRWIPNEDLTPIIGPVPVFWLKNIGCGPAKNIEITWSVEGESIEGVVAESTILHQYSPEIEEGVLYLNDPNKHHGRPFSEQLSSGLDYSISSPSNDFIEPIIIPSEIKENFEIRLIAMERPNRNFETITLPKIFLDVAYEGIYKDKYRQRFCISSHMTYMSDTVSISEIPLDRQFFSPNNLRGTIIFFVQEEDDDH